jgi:hypothetical protein
MDGEDELRFGGVLCFVAMLLAGDYLMLVGVVHDLGMDDVLNEFADNVGLVYLTGCDVSSFLYIGVKFASLHCRGVVPWLIDSWKMSVSIGASASAPILRNQGGILSGPLHLHTVCKLSQKLFADILSQNY